MKTKRRYAIAVSHTEDLASVQTDARVVLTPEDIFDTKTDVIADPFLIFHHHTWYMFMEVLNNENNRGEIGMATSGDGVHWKYCGIVIKEPFHLSYPFVFKQGQEIWMIPETARKKSVELYRATAFPHEWAREKTLLEGKKFTDTSIVETNGMFWLFSSCHQSKDLLLYYSDRITGPWQPHPQSPVVYDAPERARCAGRVVSYNGKLIRFAQDCAVVYGRSVSAFSIDKINTDEYRETPFLNGPILAGSGNGWNAEGMHHIDFHSREKGKYIAAVDGYRNMTVYGLKF